MQRFNQWLAGPKVLLLAVAAWVFLLPAVSAQATPVNMYFDGTSTVGGFDAASVSAFQAAGGQTFSPTPALFDNSTPLQSGNGPHISITTPAASPPGVGSNLYDKTNPYVRAIPWTVTALDADYNNSWIVFVMHDPSDPYPYTASDVGVQADPSTSTWRLFQQFPNTYYLAIFLGDLQQGASVTFDVNYVVGQSLFSVPGSNPTQYELPKLMVGFTQAAVPEPGSVVLLAAGLLAALAVRRRSC